MARSRDRIFVPSIRFLLCGLSLLILASLSILVARFLDLEHDPGRFSYQEGEEHLWSPLAALGDDLNNVPGITNLSSDSSWNSKYADLYYGCTSPTDNYPGLAPKSSGFLLIQASGGLNQQRIGITDAVVVARILNATLVVPSLDHKSFWKDYSNFSDIFDVDWFIGALASDVKIVKQLPSGYGRPISFRIPRKSPPRYYERKLLPLLLRKHAVQLTKFDFRLSNKLDIDLQKLRCRVNYNALQFTNPILEIGRMLVHRMKTMSGGRFIALHLRFEPDMLAFSGCYYGGGEKEVKELGAIRKRWKTLRVRSPERERRNGKCPLTPLEVGLMLRALGFNNNTYLYVASGEIYGGDQTLAPLRSLFPNFFTKDTLSTADEMLPFSSFSSRMAAIDYIVCNESDVFVTNNNGNMARILAGHRRYSGHKRTIRPNAKKLGSFFGLRQQMQWEEFSSKVRSFERGFMGDPNERSARRDVFENPSLCICQRLQHHHQHQHQHQQQQQQQQQQQLQQQKLTKKLGITVEDYEEDDQFNIDEVLMEHEDADE